MIIIKHIFFVQAEPTIEPTIEATQPGSEAANPDAVADMGLEVAAGTTAIAIRTAVITQVSEIAEKEGLPIDYNSLSAYVVSGIAQFQCSDAFTVHNSTRSWKQHYSTISFLVNGKLHADYVRLSGWLGLPPCSSTQWQRIIERLEVHVTKLAEWTCGQVRKGIMTRGDDKQWMASFDGFYLTRGHYSNNASASLHDYQTGDIASVGSLTGLRRVLAMHNWEGTSAGAEGDMFDSILGQVKAANFEIQEVITDKDSSVNGIFCRHFPEGTITYCSNHCAKTLHKDLQKIKQNKCEVGYILLKYLPLLPFFFAVPS